MYKSCWTANILALIYQYCASCRGFQRGRGRDGLSFDRGAAQHPAGLEDVPAKQRAAPVRRAVCFDSCRAAEAIMHFARVLTKWHVCVHPGIGKSCGMF